MEEDLLKLKCDYSNENIIGDLRFYNCVECKNRGYYYVVDNNEIKVKKCKCMKIRRINQSLEQCGISKKMFDTKTFESFTTAEEWQNKLKSKFIDYSKEGKESDYWLYIGGISGLGKTHLCTATIKELILNNGYSAKYMLWKDDIIKLKQMKKSSYTENIEQYEELMKEYKNVDLLYIDDFFKLIDKYSKEEDLNLAYEIINARYINNKKTIISSEFDKSQLKDFDLAIFGRIWEKCFDNEIGKNKYFLYTNYDEKMNYRLKQK